MFVVYMGFGGSRGESSQVKSSRVEGCVDMQGCLDTK